ncbi:synaptotagmin-9-like [Calliopsis andreniformis]|uniref:synaptotagmin-9-like n=1 Tax=Calliopsis andreniformis TaxID=337506 RepID=UPI003FCE1E65
MDVHNIGIVTILGAFGAATGAISAVIVYAICVNHRRLSPILGRRPLNWFEKDLLNRVETQESLKDDFIGSKSHVISDQKNNILEQTDNNFDNEKWSFNYTYDSITNESPRGESDDISVSSISSFVPPLPEGAVVALEKHMVIVKTPPNVADACFKINNTEISTLSDYKMCPSLSTSSSEENKGELNIGLMYDTSTSILTVRLVEARNLCARELSGTANPYAKIRLLPDQNNVWQTKIHRRTLDPVFDEDFVFEITPELSLAAKTLEILLYDFDAFARHYNLGYVQLHLSSVINLLHSTFTFITIPILYYDAESEIKVPLQGKLMVSLSYQKPIEKLIIILVRAKNLSRVNNSTNTSLYVEVKIMQDGECTHKKRSSTQHDTNPVWNDIVDFDIHDKLLSKCIIEFSILQGNGELVAKCEVSNKHQKDLFHRVLAGKGASAQWLPLFKPKIYSDDRIKFKH